MSEEIKKLEQKLQKKIEKQSTPKNQPSTTIKAKKIDAHHLRDLALRIQKSLNDESEYAAAHR